MQKGGIIKEEDSPLPPMETEVRKAGVRTRIRELIGRRGRVEAHEMQLPEKEDIKQSIGSLFSSSWEAQPGRTSNSLAGLADLASVYSMTFNHPLAILGVVGVIASETASAVKNYRDAHRKPESMGKEELPSYSESRDKEREYLKKCKKQIVSELKLKMSNAEKDEKKEIKEFMKRVEKLFSEIDKKSKEHLNTALGSRLEGFGISIGAAIANTYIPPFSWIANGISDYFISLAHVQSVQFQPYNPDLVLIEIVAKTVWLAVTSAIPVLVARDLHNQSKQFGKRSEAMQELESGVDEIFEKISKYV